MTQVSERVASGQKTAASKDGAKADGAKSGAPLLHQQGVEIQKYGTVYDLPIALEAEARQQSAELLNQLVADSQILYHMYKKRFFRTFGGNKS